MGKDFAKTLNPRLLLRDLLLNIWIVIAVFAGAKLCLWSYLTMSFVPQYTSSVTLAVSTRSASNAYSDLTTAESMADIMSEILESDLLLDSVRADLGEDAGSITFDASCPEGTNFLVLSVTAETAETAYEGVKSVMDHYDEVAAEVVSNVVFNVVQQPEVAFTEVTKPDADTPSNEVGLGCAVLVAAAILFFSARRPTIKQKEQIRTDLNTEVLAVLPHEILNRTLIAKLKHANKGLLITNVTSSFWFVEQVLKLRTRIEHQHRAKGYQVFLVSSLMENEGKSTVGVNLALALAQKRSRVLLVDADLRKPAVYKLLSLQDDKKSPLGDLLTRKTGLSSVVKYNRSCGMWICAGSRAVRHSTDLLGSGLMKKAIEAWKKEFDYIILDAPPMGVGADSEVLADLSDGTILVIREDCAYIDPLNDAIDCLSRTHSHFLGCVYNDVHNSHMPASAAYNNRHNDSIGKKSSKTERTNA